MAFGTLFRCVPANADLDLGKLAAVAPDQPAGSELTGVTAARDVPAVAVWGEHFIWYLAAGADDWIRIASDDVHLDQVALSRDGVLHAAGEGRVAIERQGELVWSEERGEGSISEGWRALVESRRASPSLRDPARLPAFAREWGDIAIDDDGLAQKLEGDSCPCEGGGQTRELGRVGKMHRDERWPDDDCKRGSGVGVHGWSYLLPECPPGSPHPQLMARGPDGREHEMRIASGPCDVEHPVLIGTNGREVFGFIGDELWRIDDARGKPIGRALRGAGGLAVGKDGALWAIRRGELFHWTGSAWRKVELVEDDC